MFFGHNISRILFSRNMEDADFFLDNGFSDTVFANVVVSHAFVGHGVCPIYCTAIVVEDRNW